MTCIMVTWYAAPLNPDGFTGLPAIRTPKNMLGPPEIDLKTCLFKSTHNAAHVLTRQIDKKRSWPSKSQVKCTQLYSCKFINCTMCLLLAKRRFLALPPDKPQKPNSFWTWSNCFKTSPGPHWSPKWPLRALSWASTGLVPPLALQSRVIGSNLGVCGSV